MTDYALAAAGVSLKLAGKPQPTKAARKTHPAFAAVAVTGKTAAFSLTPYVPPPSAEPHQFNRFFSSVGSLMTHV